MEPERKTIVELLEELKFVLIARATGHSFDPQKYHELRKSILGFSKIKEDLPTFVERCKTIDEFWVFIKASFSTYDQRRVFLNTAFELVSKKLEEENNTLEDYFEIGEEIGKGGFGRVYKIHHKIIDLDFAMKIFDPSFDNGDPSYLDRFFREVRISIKLMHKNIVRIFDAGYFRDKPFIKMEFIEGETLWERVKKEPITPEKALKYIKMIAEALSYAQSEINIIHRDLKPSNIMITPLDEIKIIDFGQGIFIEKDLVSRITKTSESAVGGPYTAPELIEDPHIIDKRTDIFSVGAIWYYLLTGKSPAGTNIEKYLKDSQKIDDIYLEMVMKCLDITTNRYSDFEELLLDINKYLETKRKNEIINAQTVEKVEVTNP